MLCLLIFAHLGQQMMPASITLIASIAASTLEPPSGNVQKWKLMVKSFSLSGNGFMALLDAVSITRTGTRRCSIRTPSRVLGPITALLDAVSIASLAGCRFKVPGTWDPMEVIAHLLCCLTDKGERPSSLQAKMEMNLLGAYKIYVSLKLGTC